MLDSMQKAIQQAYRLLCAEWDSDKCAVCGTEKWKYYPFCRLCSIALQRKNMMAGWPSHFGRPAKDIGANDFVAAAWQRWYDQCRDFLMLTKRLYNKPGRTEMPGAE